MLVNCSQASTDDAAASEDAVTGVGNALGLALAYDAPSGRIQATVKSALPAGDDLYVRVRRGTIVHESQEKMDCGELAKTEPLNATARRLPIGRTVYDGPAVDPALVTLIDLYNDVRWYTGRETPEMKAEIDKGPDPIVEACVVRDGRVKARLLTNLAYARDRGVDLARAIAAAARPGGTQPASVVDTGLVGMAADGGVGGTLAEGQSYNTIDYANLCVQELGEIPFFKKNADGRYETFDCRDFVGSNGTAEAAPVPGVEGKSIPLTIDDQPKTECDDGRSSRQTYDCVNKCDRAMWLTASSHTGLGVKAACQPGVTVTTAKNEKGSHWTLLCRKVEASQGASMMNTKTFNDIAIIGNNPLTGKTCFFQNKENVGNDGARVVHPGDVARSTSIWPSQPASYCTGSCHAADAFIHSPWIDQALRGDGTSIVPKMGEHADYPISDPNRPYKVVNAAAQGFVISPQLVSEPAQACATCHRVAGEAFAEFAEWATGKGDPYYGKITDSYKAFEKSHWMPLRLDGLDASNFERSEWGQAVTHIRSCMDDASAPGCEFAPVPTAR